MLGEKLVRLKTCYPGTEFSVEHELKSIRICEERGREWFVDLAGLGMTADQWVDQELAKRSGPEPEDDYPWYVVKKDGRALYTTTDIHVALDVFWGMRLAGREPQLFRGDEQFTDYGYCEKCNRPALFEDDAGLLCHHCRKPKYQVLCVHCGPRTLTEEQYRRQMFRPELPWYCPNCGHMADWDDESLGGRDE